jgi:hypothetical protein
MLSPPIALVRGGLFLGNRLGYDIKRDFPRQGTHHNALDDAIYQAEYVMKIHGLITDLHQDG